MKKYNIQIRYLIVVTFLITINFNVRSQSWDLAGNGLSGNEVFGSTTNFPLDFYTNGSQRMSLSTFGNLGLSDVWPFTPLSLVHLNRNAATAVSTRFTNVNSINGGALFGIDANGNARINQQGPLAINFLTNGTQRVSIRG